MNPYGHAIPLHIKHNLIKFIDAKTMNYLPKSLCHAHVHYERSPFTKAFHEFFKTHARLCKGIACV
jgi:hypothetical protein